VGEEKKAQHDKKRRETVQITRKSFSFTKLGEEEEMEFLIEEKEKRGDATILRKILQTKRKKVRRGGKA